MRGRTLLSSGGFVLVFALALTGCQRSGRTTSEGTTVDLDQGTFHLTGPYAHQNLSVFLIHSKDQDDRDFITLDQGLADGLVSVAEKDQEQVSELQIENRSDQPLFLQEGDRIKGGKQDRTIIASLVIPPKSGKMPLPTFCIEQGRWGEGAGGKAFHNTSNFALATKEVRQAAKIHKSQGQVWAEVRAQKEVAQRSLNAGNATTSLNEALDDPAVQKVSDEFAAALSSVLENQDSAVGVAIVVNGKVEEVNIYPNRKLLGKLYPRLLQSYALQATAEKDKAAEAKSVSCEEIAEFMKTEGQEKSKHTDAVNADNRMAIGDLEKRYSCSTEYKGKVVHRQVMSKVENRSQP